MAIAKLAEALRAKIREFYEQGYGREDVFQIVKTEGYFTLKLKISSGEA
jgi:hypothetical protein